MRGDGGHHDRIKEKTLNCIINASKTPEANDMTGPIR